MAGLRLAGNCAPSAATTSVPPALDSSSWAAAPAGRMARQPGRCRRAPIARVRTTQTPPSGSSHPESSRTFSVDDAAGRCAEHRARRPRGYLSGPWRSRPVRAAQVPGVRRAPVSGSSRRLARARRRRTSRSSAGSRTSAVGAPAQDPDPRTSCTPETVALQTSEPSASGSVSWLGCQRVSATRAATSGEKRTTTRTSGSSEMTSHAASRSRAMVVAAGPRTSRGSATPPGSVRP